jgi:tyrosyl-tRNA synthetase
MSEAPGKSFAPVAEQIALLTRGAVDVHVVKELEERLEASRTGGKPLKVKAGFDPTRPDLHLGHAVLLNKLRQFQELGHEVTFVVGEFTAMVGDPTGANDARPRLTREDVQKAAVTYTEQCFKILDRSTTVVRSNGEWLDKLTPGELVELMAKSTVSRMLERNDFATRFAEHRPIHIHEFLYPLLQAYDSVALDSDIELGGTDQLFNLLVGRDLMPKYGQRAQMVLTVPLLEGIDARIDEGGKVVGKKMSKSADNYVGILEAPAVQYRKIMQVDDRVIWRYYELLSAKTNEEIAALKAEANPLDAKSRFALEIITRFHGAEAAEAAKAEFGNSYLKDELPAEIAEVNVPTDGATLWIAKALSAAGLVKSTGEGKRLVEQGGVEVDRVRVTDAQLQLEGGTRYLLRVGSKVRRFAYVTVSRAS